MMLYLGQDCWWRGKAEALEASRGRGWRVSRGISERKKTWPEVSLSGASSPWDKGTVGCSGIRPEAVRVSELVVDTSDWSHTCESYLPPGRDSTSYWPGDTFPLPSPPSPHLENDLQAPEVRWKQKYLKLLQQSLENCSVKSSTLCWKQ